MKTLPIASSADVRRYVWRLFRRHPRQMAGTLALHALAAASGIMAPRLVGELVGDVQAGVDRVEITVLLIFLFILGQSALLCAAVYQSAKLAERVIAQLREDFIRDVLDLPLSTVEQAGVGDLVARSTRDVDSLAQTVRNTVPSTLVAITTLIVVFGAIAFTGWLMLIPALAVLPALAPTARWYLRRARPGYLAEQASHAQAAETLTETVIGARTVEALAIAPRRIDRMRDAVGTAYRAERYTLWLRTVFLPISDTTVAIPVVATVVVGGLFYLDGRVTLAAVIAATLYSQQLAGQLDLLLYQQDKLQVGGAAMARLLGVNGETTATPDREYTETPGRRELEVRDVRFAYGSGPDILHEVSLTVRAGERLAIVGASGAGKTTLGRLIAGIDQPTAGSVTLGGVRLETIPRGRLRAQIVLVTQEYHVFRETLRDNLLMARPDASEARLREVLTAVGAGIWAIELGLDTPLGPGSRDLSPAEAQQVSLARLLLSDPHTLVLDEATALLDPRMARDLERSFAAVLEGRTVISIAHRLHTAHDADRVLVMDAGRIVEEGTHDELILAGGAYEALWNAWHGKRAVR
ncbi:ABC transporter ATP-binding protein [Micromonospora sp. LOL_024]|uniref:ABC transporter ATP-binding protein n=1 Tax=Micromonospora sp. LOL_024 TaxID=3345412 RepID=UPI003A875BD8